MLFRHTMKTKQAKPVGWHRTRSRPALFGLQMRTYVPASIYINTRHSRYVAPSREIIYIKRNSRTSQVASFRLHKCWLRRKLHQARIVSLRVRSCLDIGHRWHTTSSQRVAHISHDLVCEGWTGSMIHAQKSSATTMTS